MEINLPQYMNASERLEYIKIIHKVTSSIKKENSGTWTEGYLTALYHIEMVLSGAIKKVVYPDGNNK